MAEAAALRAVEAAERTRPRPHRNRAGPALNAIAAIVPNALPNASVTAPPLPSANFANGLSSGPFVYSAAGKVTYGTSSPPLTVTDNDTSGATCLVYEAAGASSATPCPFAASTSSVTLTNANDGYAVLYNAKFLAGGALMISAPGFTSLTVSITPTTIGIGSAIRFTGGEDADRSAIVYEPTSKKLFVAVYGSRRIRSTSCHIALDRLRHTLAGRRSASVNGNPAATALSGHREWNDDSRWCARPRDRRAEATFGLPENNATIQHAICRVYVRNGATTPTRTAVH